MSAPFWGPLPSMRALRTFECAARRKSFTAAAEELHTTQPAISRTVAELERRLAIRLFERRHRSVRLTTAGEMYFEIVRLGLSRIAAGGAAIAELSDDNRVVIACGRATSEMFLRSQFWDLHQALGDGAMVRILALDYDMLGRLDAFDADIVLSYDTEHSAPGEHVMAFREAVVPVCSPAYADEHADTLGRPVAEWNSIKFIYVARPSRSWVTWENWFEVVGRPRPEPCYENYEDYIQVIDAALAGRGLALGWRHFIENHVELGMLVKAMDGFVEFDRAHYAKLTERGRNRSIARRCLDFFANCEQGGGTHGTSAAVAYSGDSDHPSRRERDRRFRAK